MIEEERTPDSINRRGARLIWRFMTSHPLPTVVSICGAVCYAAAAVGSTVAVGRVTDRLITPAFNGGVSSSTVIGGVLLIVIVGLLKGSSVVVRRYFAAMLEARMQVTLRRGVVDKYLTVPLSFHNAHPTGELLAHADADVTGTTMVIKPLPFSIGLIALAVFSLISLVLVDWTFAVIALTLFPLLIAVNRYYTRRVELPSASVQQRLGRVSAVAHESFDGALVVKTLGLEEVESARFAVAADRLRSKRLEVGRLRATFEPIIDALPNFGILALLLVGSWRVRSGAVTRGDLVQASLLFSVLGLPMRVFGFFLEEVPRSVVSVERVDAVLAAPEAVGAAIDPPRTLPDGPLGISVDDLWFTYEGSSRDGAAGEPVLRGVDFEVAPGETVALVGSTGSGKSTLQQLLVRLLEPTTGAVRIGGVPVSDLDPEVLRAAVSLVFQESFLFATTLRDNIVLGTESAPGDATGRDQPARPSQEDDSRLMAVADTARIARFVDHLAQQWETVLGERGVTLSGGQRQRVALARALMREPRVLLLDDATSAVDPVIEAEILSGLRRHHATLLIVAHRLSTIALADRVVFLDRGRVGGIGTHEELLSMPRYAALVHAYEVEDESFDAEPSDLDEQDIVA